MRSFYLGSATRRSAAPAPCFCPDLGETLKWRIEGGSTGHRSRPRILSPLETRRPKSTASSGPDSCDHGTTASGVWAGAGKSGNRSAMAVRGGAAPRRTPGSETHRSAGMRAAPGPRRCRFRSDPAVGGGSGERRSRIDPREHSAARPRMVPGAGAVPLPGSAPQSSHPQTALPYRARARSAPCSHAAISLAPPRPPLRRCAAQPATSCPTCRTFTPSSGTPPTLPPGQGIGLDGKADGGPRNDDNACPRGRARGHA